MKKTGVKSIYAIIFSIFISGGAIITAEENLPAGLIGHYPFNDNFQDASGNGHDLETFLANPPFTDDIYIREGNRSYGPVNAVDQMPAARSAQMPSSISKGMTLAFFVRNSASHDYSCEVIRFGGTEWNSPAIMLAIDFGHLKIKVGRNIKSIRSPERVISLDGRWHHAALVIPPDSAAEKQQFTLYLDGRELMQAPLQRLPDYGTLTILGSAERSINSMMFDEIMIFNRALESGEIKELAKLSGKPQVAAAENAGKSASTTPSRDPIPEEPVTARPISEFAEQVAPGIFKSKQDRIDAVYVLSPQWILLANDYMKEINERIYLHQQGEWDNLYRYRQDLENEIEKQGGRLDWGKLKRRRYLYINSFAKLATYHLWMRQSGAFSVRSGDDDDYEESQDPQKAVSWINSLGDAQWENAAKLRNEGWSYQIGNYAYLKLPFPLKDGKSYSIEQKDGRRTRFSFEQTSTINPCIKVNQVGYLPDAPRKFAYLGGWIPTVGPIDFSEFGSFAIINADKGVQEFSGTIKLRVRDFQIRVDNDSASYAGEDIYELDFSEFRKSGRYYIMIPGLGRSWTFCIGDNALGEAFYVAARGFYHQRCGCALSKPFTQWERGVCHKQPVGECDFVGDNLNWRLPDGSNALKKHSDFDIIRDTGREDKLHDVWGGWHDAADYDRRASHNIPAWDLMLLYEINPDAFTDGQLNLPESGNGIPDLLDEARWGLDVWKRAQQADGGVTGRIETIHHPQHKGMPDCDTDRFYMSLPDRKSSLLYAGGAAMYARLVKPFSEKEYREYLLSAKKAYKWASNPGNSRNGHTVTLDNGTKVTLIEEESDILFPACMTALNLYLASGEAEYLEDLNSKYGAAAAERLHSYPNYQYYYVPVYLLAAKAIDGLDNSISTTARESITGLAEEPLTVTLREPYRHAWRQRSRRWGWALAPYWARYLILAHKLTGDKKYQEAALFNIDFHLGCNPLGMAQTTGLGTVYIPTLQDAEIRRDGIPDPVPGLTSYGVVDIPYTFLTRVLNINIPDIGSGKTISKISLLPEGFSNGKPPIPHWRRIAPSGFNDPICNEFSVPQTTGPIAFVFGAYLGKGWMPDEQLKQRVPRNKSQIPGYFWIP